MKTIIDMLITLVDDIAWDNVAAIIIAFAMFWTVGALVWNFFNWIFR